MIGPVHNRRSQPPMTDEQAERLRTKVPDEAVMLPEGHLACEACGVAVATRKVVSSVPPPGRQPTTSTADFTRCSECQRVHDLAGEYVIAHPGLAGRIGPGIAHERIESVLHGLTILGQPLTDDLGLLLPRLHPAAHGVWFSNPLTLTRDRCSPYPWAHVTLSQRAELRKAYAACLRDRLALSAPPVAIGCPSGGCLFCGVASVRRAAIEVARAGGIEVVTRSVWRRLYTTPVSLGGNGQNYLDGHTCPDCTRTIEDRGAVGWPARAQALVAFVARSSIPKAERLRREIEGDLLLTLPGWGALNLRPSVEPWAHLRRVIDRL